MYYMPEERLNIGRRVFTQEISKEKGASEYNISITTVVNYVKEYMKANKISQTEIKVLSNLVVLHKRHLLSYKHISLL